MPEPPHHFCKERPQQTGIGPALRRGVRQAAEPECELDSNLKPLISERRYRVGQCAACQKCAARLMIIDEMTGRIEAVHLSPKHTIAKASQPVIRLLAGLGVEGDAHMGATVKHRSRARYNRGLPNLRQVHLIHSELHDELRADGFDVRPGQMGENITTRDLDLLGLPAGARLHIGAEAVVELTGLRNPCDQLDSIHAGLMQATLGRDKAGNLIRKAGVMGVVVTGGEVRPGDLIRVELPLVAQPLLPV